MSGKLRPYHIDDYSIRARKQILTSFTNQESLKQGVQNLLLSLAQFYSQPKGPSLGCLLIGTALPASSQYDGIRDTLSGFLSSLDRLLEESIDASYSDDALSLSKSPHLLALQISSLVYNLANRARTGLSKKQVSAYANELADLI